MPQRFQFLVDGDTYFECDLECVKCKGSTLIGMPCKRKSCIGTPYCWSHLRSEKKLRIKPSRLRGAGKGLFVDAPGEPRNAVIFERGDKIIAYDGEVVSSQMLSARYGRHTAPYGAPVRGSRNKYEDGACRRGAGTLANHCPQRTNAELYPRGGRIILKALEDIHNGDEIYLDYGPQYTFDEGVSNSTKRTRRSQGSTFRGRQRRSR